MSRKELRRTRWDYPSTMQLSSARSELTRVFYLSVDSNSFDAPTKQETTPRSDLAEAEAEAALALASVAHSIIPNRSTSPVHTGAPAIPLPLPADYNPDLPICANCNTQVSPPRVQ